MSRAARLPALMPLAALAIAGCAGGIGSTRYGCKGLPERSVCLSATEVYAATEHAEQLSGETKAGAKATASAPAPRVRVAPQPGPPNATVPVRTPAQVLRVWIAPWEDDDGDLHVEGYVYSEVAPRRWSLARPVRDGERSLRPLQVLQPDGGKASRRKETREK